MKQEGILFPRHTYAKWMIDSSDQYLEKVYRYMHRRLLEEDIIYADEIHHYVFTDGRKGSQLKQTYIWMFRKISCFMSTKEEGAEKSQRNS